MSILPPEDIAMEIEIVETMFTTVGFVNKYLITIVL